MLQVLGCGYTIGEYLVYEPRYDNEDKKESV